MTETAAPKTSGLVAQAGRYPCVDGLRAMAALLIMAHHVWLFTGTGGGISGEFLARGHVGLALLYQVSGFLIYRPFVAARVRGREQPSTRPFLARRFLRVFPGFWFAMLGVMLVLRTAENWSLKATLSRFTLTWVYFPDLLGSRDGLLRVAIGQSWTLNVEILYYLFLPAYAFAVRAVARRAARPELVELGGLLTLMAGSVVTLWFQFAEGLGRWEYYIMLPTGMLYLATGMLLAWCSVLPKPPRLMEVTGRHPVICWGLGLFVFWFMATRLGLYVEFGEAIPRSAEVKRELLENVMGFLLFAPAVFGDQSVSVVRRFLRNRVVSWLGMVSYGMYLWHIDLLHRILVWVPPDGTGPRFFLTLALVLASSVGIAAFSYYVVERPTLRLKDRFEYVR